MSSFLAGLFVFMSEATKEMKAHLPDYLPVLHEGKSVLALSSWIDLAREVKVADPRVVLGTMLALLTALFTGSSVPLLL